MVGDELIDEHGKTLVDVIIKHYGDEDLVVEEMCSQVTEACGEGGDEGGGGKKKKKKKKDKKKKKKKKGKQDL